LDILTLEHLAKNYENEPLLTDLSLEVRSGELLCLLGRSGSGNETADCTISADCTANGAD
jgi:ABC-type multidrug transport system ATPase subunit